MTPSPEPQASEQPAPEPAPATDAASKDERSGSPETGETRGDGSASVLDADADKKAGMDAALPQAGEAAQASGEAPKPSGEAAEATADADGAPPLPSEPVPGGPPLPDEPVPPVEDDGWDCQWDPASQAWFFHNRLTGQSQWDNPRLAVAAAQQPPAAAAPAPAGEPPVVSGYNPAIHGDYDPNAWYAQPYEQQGPHEGQAAPGGIDADAAAYGASATFNRFTGQFQATGAGPERHSDEAKSQRQMNAFFDVDAAANVHDGRSLKAERSNKKPSKAELKAFKEKRRARKEEKRRAWLRD